MPVSNEIFPQLSILYHEYSISADEDAFFKQNKKKIKVISDSLWEQIVESIINIKPRNYLDARSIINANIERITIPDDRNTLLKLNVVLQNYELLLDKCYVNLSNKMSPMFVIHLKKLCEQLVSHGSHTTTENSLKLKNLLMKIK